MAIYTALFDANVLYSAPVTDLVMELASTHLFRARWSDHIHEEWIASVLKDRPDLTRDQLERRRSQMDSALHQPCVTGYDGLIGALELPDPDDRHVLAAAIEGRADVIVTYNMKDFPGERLLPHGVEAQHPDEFLNFQRTLNETLFITCVKNIRARLTEPVIEANQYIENLNACQLPTIAAELYKVQKLI